MPQLEWAGRKGRRDDHHLFYPKKSYRGGEKRFRKLRCVQLRSIDIRWHALAHYAMDPEPPAKPSLRWMLAVRLRHQQGRCSCSHPEQLLEINLLDLLQIMGVPAPACCVVKVDPLALRLFRQHFRGATRNIAGIMQSIWWRHVNGYCSCPNPASSNARVPVSAPIIAGT